MIVTGRDAEVAAWVMARTRRHEGETFGPCTAIGVVRDGRLICGWVYSQFQPDYRSVHVTVAADTPLWATRGHLAVLFGYPFHQLGCRRLTATVRRKNRRCRRVAEGLGFKLEGVLRRGCGDDCMCIYGILRPDAAQWLNRGG